MGASAVLRLQSGEVTMFEDIYGTIARQNQQGVENTGTLARKDMTCSLS